MKAEIYKLRDNLKFEIPVDFWLKGVYGFLMYENKIRIRKALATRDKLIKKYGKSIS